MAVCVFLIVKREERWFKNGFLERRPTPGPENVLPCLKPCPLQMGHISFSGRTIAGAAKIGLVVLFV